ncbi:hypothetical protein FALBO_8259 [Fusarium albosuccineum]|uniref:Uncharacterized protein n=1 Tax=Fusarium albosuccineum TaxID=1237068 RepID=A0A8H4LC90_9HYPO|nr:hypothetical protein FALBO_8259 [Fusarium albosuccineum]
MVRRKLFGRVTRWLQPEPFTPACAASNHPAVAQDLWDIFAGLPQGHSIAALESVSSVMCPSGPAAPAVEDERQTPRKEDQLKKTERDSFFTSGFDSIMGFFSLLLYLLAALHSSVAANFVGRPGKDNPDGGLPVLHKYGGGRTPGYLFGGCVFGLSQGIEDDYLRATVLCPYAVYSHLSGDRVSLVMVTVIKFEDMGVQNTSDYNFGPYSIYHYRDSGLGDIFDVDWGESGRGNENRDGYIQDLTVASEIVETLPSVISGSVVPGTIIPGATILGTTIPGSVITDGGDMSSSTDGSISWTTETWSISPSNTDDSDSDTSETGSVSSDAESASLSGSETVGPTSIQTAGGAQVTAALGIGALFGVMGLLA